MSEVPLPSWSKRDNFSVDSHQSILDRLNQLSNITGDANVSRDPFGLDISFKNAPTFFGKSVKVRATRTATKPGVYFGKIMRGIASPDPTSTTPIDEPEGQTEIGWEDAIIINLSEDTSQGNPPGTADTSTYSGHLLDIPSYQLGVITGVRGSGGLSYFVVELPRPAPLGTLFRVNLASTGGTDGSKTTSPSFTYTVTSLAGNTLGTVMSPERPRIFGSVTQATKGTGYLDATGNFVLAEAWEIPNTGGCP